jgi:8-oxo-dGTP diphosphatase
MTSPFYTALLKGFDLPVGPQKPKIKTMCLGFAFCNEARQVVLITKSHPPFLKDKLNGIGGKVEQGETPRDAMVREAAEEAGIDESPQDWTPLGVIQAIDDSYVIYCFRMHEFKNYDVLMCSISEPVDWYSISELGAHTLAPHTDWLIKAALGTPPHALVHLWA